MSTCSLCAVAAVGSLLSCGPGRPGPTGRRHPGIELYRRSGPTRRLVLVFAAASEEVPWTIGQYHTKRISHKTDKLGNVPSEAYDDLVNPPGWDKTSQEALAIECVAAELGLADDVITARISQLKQLLPDLAGKLTRIKVGDLARLSARVDDVVPRLVFLRGQLPGGNVSAMVSEQPTLLLLSNEQLGTRIAGVRAQLPSLSPGELENLVCECPAILDVDALSRCLLDLRRFMPTEDLGKALAANPMLFYNTQSRDKMIACVALKLPPS